MIELFKIDRYIIKTEEEILHGPIVRDFEDEFAEQERNTHVPLTVLAVLYSQRERMVVSNDEDKIQWIGKASLNGMTYNKEKLEQRDQVVGWKMYMNTVQASIALRNLRTLETRKERLAEIRSYYNKRFNLSNSSNHLYRITVANNDLTVSTLAKAGITAGIHYRPLHLNPLYAKNHVPLRASEFVGETTVSIPLHHNLSNGDVKYVADKVEKLCRR